MGDASVNSGDAPSLDTPCNNAIVNSGVVLEEKQEMQSTIPAPVKVRSLAAGQVDRVVASALPNGMHISKDARVALQKSAAVFLMYIACLAEDSRSRVNVKRVTLSSQDIRTALVDAGMSHLVPLLSTGNLKRARHVDDHSSL
ncbi:uncharacterized protein TM35_000171610 [Trypanosoma theileri]|uniref:Transcription factor CBF/NF-Y/archaeal histone domain-containing protein n=1 Tax=Trypanosoma theileri TaxID=67003 RepID=A0A1X0NVP7_9TRYP|nr:uncharacterized protein TM35_000171610 [Trypanosoma theileri]ORC88289.1 hypothetical protein TM35_000171610 [Trypanosoma theileri]